MQVRRLIQGQLPLVVSIPHGGTYLPADIKSRMTAEALRLPDTDWHLDRLYGFLAERGVSVLSATHSRYVIDLNRSMDNETLYAGQVKTGLVPAETFDGRKIYQADEEPDGIEKVNRIAAYWMPYHDALQEEIARLKSAFGYVMLYDAHSIRSEVPRLFDGVLPDLNLGTVNGASCAAGLSEAIMTVIGGQEKFSAVRDGRFIGGHITRSYGQPHDGIHAVQMELACQNYMDEQSFIYDETSAPVLQAVLSKVIDAMLDWGRKTYGASPNQ